MRKLFMIMTILLTTFSCSKKDEVIYILPENYTGYIVVLYDQNDGEEVKYEGSKRVYKIPESGILKTKFKADYGWSEFPEFYFDEISEENRIPYKYDFKEVPKDSVVCYGGTTGTANRDLEGTSTVKFTNYYIGNEAQIREAIKKTDSFDYVQLADN